MGALVYNSVMRLKDGDEGCGDDWRSGSGEALREEEGRYSGGNLGG